MTSRGPLIQHPVDPACVLCPALAAVAVRVREQQPEASHVIVGDSAARQQHGERDMQQVSGLP